MIIMTICDLKMWKNVVEMKAVRAPSVLIQSMADRQSRDTLMIWDMELQCIVHVAAVVEDYADIWMTWSDGQELFIISARKPTETDHGDTVMPEVSEWTVDTEQWNASINWESQRRAFNEDEL